MLPLAAEDFMLEEKKSVMEPGRPLASVEADADILEVPDAFAPSAEPASSAASCASPQAAASEPVAEPAAASEPAAATEPAAEPVAEPAAASEPAAATEPAAEPVAASEPAVAAANEIACEDAGDNAELAGSAADSKEALPGFERFAFCEELQRGLREAGFSEPTPIQAKAIPELLAGRDLIGQALTGTGKTAAFGLPAMEKIRGEKGLQLLVLVPTRELAAQVSAELFRLGRYTGLKTAAFTGGQSYNRQEQLLRQGINALVATPGRLLDLIESGHFSGVNPSFVVVDEADEMLDMGFLDDVKQIFAAFPEPRQTMLFSATMPRPVVTLAQSVLQNPVDISTGVNESANNDIEQLFCVIEDSERVNAIIRLIDAENVRKAIIFCRTREETDSLNIVLGGRGYNVNCLHGDMEQAARNRVMSAFRRSDIDILVATDVAARGLDVDDVTHVFNFHMPFDSRGYVHRIGRTGRAGRAGTAITLVTPREMRQLEAIRKNVGAQLENRLIPTRTEVSSRRLKSIFRELLDDQLDVEMLNQVQTLSTNQDLLVLLTKLLSRQLAGGGDLGPETIGIAGQRLDRILSPQPREQRGGRRGRSARRPAKRGGGFHPRDAERSARGGERGKTRQDASPGARAPREPAAGQRPARGSETGREDRASAGRQQRQKPAADYWPPKKRERADAGQAEHGAAKPSPRHGDHGGDKAARKSEQAAAAKGKKSHRKRLMEELPPAPLPAIKKWYLRK
jgi:ATP-dependent RNA helicase DeaD